ncbi:hypothetical protein O988_09302 [Pseudogymnoascus sp. VKM F-3808]|nr:hypothetical protein O988_09302 [Pseudogymnoascus sp. VKM F-3808]
MKVAWATAANLPDSTVPLLNHRPCRLAHCSWLAYPGVILFSTWLPPRALLSCFSFPARPKPIGIRVTIHQLGVLQGDSEARNILVHPGRRETTWIDFERAEFVRPRAVLGTLSPRKGSLVSRGREVSVWKGQQEDTRIRDASSYDRASEIGGEAGGGRPHSAWNAYEGRKKPDSRMNSLRKSSLMSLVTDISVRDSANLAHETQITSSTQEATSHSTISTSISDVSNTARSGGYLPGAASVEWTMVGSYWGRTRVTR